MSIEEDIKTNIMDSISRLTDLVTSIRKPPPPSEQDELDKPLTSSEVGSGLIKDIEALGIKDAIQDIILIVKLFALGNQPVDDSQYQVNQIIKSMS